MKKMDGAYLKKVNRLMVLDLFLSGNDYITKTYVTQETGLSTTAIMKIFDYFLEIGFITEEEKENNNMIGRNPSQYSFNYSAILSIGILYEGSKCFVGIVNLKGEVLRFKEYQSTKDITYWVHNELLSIITEFMDSNEDYKNTIFSIGLGVPGIVNHETHCIESAPTVNNSNPLFYDDISTEVLNKTGLPILIENSVNCGAYGELSIRKGSGIQNMAYIALGHGLGAGLILSGNLYRGKNNSAGEIGYLNWDITNIPDRKIPGTLESKINISALLKRWPNILDPDCNMMIVGEAMGFVCDQLTLCVANLQMVLDLETVVLGGSLIERLQPQIIDAMHARLMQYGLDNVKCELEQGISPEVIGCALLSLRERLGDIFLSS